MVNEYTTLRSLGHYEPGHESSEQREMLDKIGDVQREGNHLGMSSGVTLLFVNKVFGFVWENIPNNRFDEIKSFIKQNGKWWLKTIDEPFYWRYVAHVKNLAADQNYDALMHDDVKSVDWGNHKADVDPIVFSPKECINKIVKQSEAAFSPSVEDELPW